MAESATLSPQQAATALAGIVHHEEALSTRLGALTGMVWGVVSAAIFVTYGFAPAVEPAWVVGFLWVPWTLGGIVLTVCIWRLHALTLRSDPTAPRHSAWPWILGFVVLFGIAILGLQALDLHQEAFAYMLVVNGIAAFAIVAAVSRQAGRLSALPMVPAGVLLVAGAFVLGGMELSAMAMAFASAALVAIAFVGGGLVGFVRG